MGKILQLQVGDHIFAVRAIGYSHHGIYVGEQFGVKYVIHFTTTIIKSRKKPACQACGYEANVHLGVVKTCLDCFRSGDSLQVKDYYGNSKPSEEVVETAYRLLQNGFGQYELVMNNCEHFATFCKTGTPKSAQVETATDIALQHLIMPRAPIIEFSFVLSKFLRSQFGTKPLIKR